MTDDDAMRLARVIAQCAFDFSKQPLRASTHAMMVATAIREADAAGYARGIEDAGEIGIDAIRFAHEWIGGLPITPTFEDKRAAQSALEKSEQFISSLSANPLTSGGKPTRLMEHPSKERHELDALLAKLRSEIEEWRSRLATRERDAANTRAARMLAALQEPSDGMLEEAACAAWNKTMDHRPSLPWRDISPITRLIVKEEQSRSLRAVAEWLKKNVR